MKAGAILCGLLCAPTLVAAHDFWIQPATFHAHIGENVGVGLCEGDPFMGRMFPRNAARIEQFLAKGPAGEQPIVGRDGRQVAGVARFVKPGVYVLGYRGKPSVTEIEAWRFEQYLVEKGLERIARVRQQRGTTHEGVRESYSRYSKSLLQVGDAPDGAVTDPIGLRLELVPEFDLTGSGRRAQHSFRLLFDGKPLEGALVKATARSQPDNSLVARTDSDGRVQYSLRAPGEWIVTVVHMTEAAAGGPAEWESFWSSLTFEIRANGDGVSPRASGRLCAS